MRQAVILGSSDTKRTIYLEKAAAQEGVSVTLVDWQEWETYHELPDAEEPGKNRPAALDQLFS